MGKGSVRPLDRGARQPRSPKLTALELWANQCRVASRSHTCKPVRHGSDGWCTSGPHRLRRGAACAASNRPKRSRIIRFTT